MAAWGGYQNGQIPLKALAPIPWKPNLYLHSDAVNALVALNIAYRSHFGRDLPISDGYRDFAGQVYMRNWWCSRGKCNNAAVPGESNHGWAVAIDIGVPINGWTNPIYLWMKANAPTYGWVHPQWAEPGDPGGPDEAWHWEYNGTYTETAPTPEPAPALRIEDDMYYQALTGSTDGLIPAGYMYVNAADGPLRALNSLEGGAIAYFYPNQIAKWDGNDIRNLVKIVGLRQQGSTQGLAAATGAPIVNDGRLTGTIVY